MLQLKKPRLGLRRGWDSVFDYFSSQFKCVYLLGGHITCVTIFQDEMS